jgi:glycosyltransferase involved in cell wall biosynthesis
MKLLVALEHHFRRGPDGCIYVQSPLDYAFWRRYLEVFEEVAVLARVGEGGEALAPEARADGQRVTFWPLPDYLGPWQYLRRLRALKARVRKAVRACDAYILRVPGLVGRLAWFEIKRLGRPYAVEVVGDPWDVLAPGSMPGPFRPLYRRITASSLRKQCRGASATAYVTSEALQRRYPPGNNTFATHYSSVELSGAFTSPDHITQRTNRLQELVGGSGGSARPIRLGFVGSLAQLYKGPDTLLHAASLCLRQGIALEVSLVGDGRYRAAMEDFARRLGVDKQACFLGHLPPGQAVYEFLDKIDLFVMPSRQEGLPRAMIEAMARGCPCIGSRVGGIPELLANDDMVPPDDPEALAARIAEVASDPERMFQMARRNLEKAQEYRPEVLAARRTAFYRSVRQRIVS